MIIKIIKYTLVFILGGLVMASNQSLYQKTHDFLHSADHVVKNITHKK